MLRCDGCMKEPLLINRLDEADIRIERADCEGRFVVFTDGTVLPITRVFDELGNETSDDDRAALIEFGSSETGWGELEVHGVKWVKNQ